MYSANERQIVADVLDNYELMNSCIKQVENIKSYVHPSDNDMAAFS